MLAVSPLLLALCVDVTSILKELPLSGRAKMTPEGTCHLWTRHRGGRNDKRVIIAEMRSL